LEDFFKDQDAMDTDSQHLYYHTDYVSQKPFKAEDIPEFYELPMQFGEGLLLALYDLLFLILFNIFLFVTAFVSFMRYDVR